MSSIVKRKGVWHIQYITGGRKLHRSTRIKVKDDPGKKLAEQVQRDWDSATAKATAGLGDLPVTIWETLKRHAESKKRFAPRWVFLANVRAERWAEFFSKLRINHFEGIKPEHIEQYIRDRREVVSAKTVKEELVFLRGAVRLLNAGRKISLIDISAWPKLTKVPAGKADRIGAYTPEEIRGILEELHHPRREHWYLPVLFLAFTGCRFGEMQRVKAGDFRDRFVRLESRKTAKNPSDQHRMVELHPRLKKEMAPLLSRLGPGEPLFPWIKEDNHDLVKVLARACKRRGYQYRRVHGLRHAWITEMLRAGVPVPIVMKMAGHTQMATTMRYLDLTDGATAGYVSAVDAFDGVADQAEAEAPSGEPVSLREYAQKKASVR